MNVERTDIRLYADPKKVLLRYLNLGLNSERINPVVEYVNNLTEEEISQKIKEVSNEFAARHYNLKEKLLENYEKISPIIKTSLSLNQKLLIGAFFTHEYSIQAAALFNPSIVLHPDQSNLEKGELRFILSLRSTGEGHISSISFLSGKISQDGHILLNANNRFICEGQIKELDDGYEIHFSESIPLNSRVLFPFQPEESMGMEDVRFVEMQEGDCKYVGTYTAYNGRKILPKLILTNDFVQFKIVGLKGKIISNKGLALFPRKINGKFAMIGRQDGRNLTLMYSDHLTHWDEYSILQQPKYDWEMLQIGNNGSPIETEHGWLLLTHGVGPMRKYSLGMTLLDLNHPSKIINRMELPLMSPMEEEREGYVPNVLYTCGMLAYNGMIYIPYAMSDHAISFAKVKMNELLDKLLKS